MLQDARNYLMSHNFDELRQIAERMCNDNPSVMHHWHPETLRKMLLMTLCGMVLSSLLCGANEIRGIANKCLDVRGGDSDNGTPVEIWPCHGGANQEWRFVHGELPGVGDKCLDVKGGVSDDGTLIILWRCHGSANQKWRMRHFVQ